MGAQLALNKDTSHPEEADSDEYGSLLETLYVGHMTSYILFTWFEIALSHTSGEAGL